jgi:hypothetical protein
VKFSTGLPGCLEYVRAQPGFAARTRPFNVVLPLTTLAVDEHLDHLRWVAEDIIPAFPAH